MCRTADYNFSSYVPVQLEVGADQGFAALTQLPWSGLSASSGAEIRILGATNVELYAAAGIRKGVLVSRSSALPSLSSTSIPFSTALPAATASFGFVRSSAVYYEYPVVGATIQVRDSVTMATLTATSAVRIVVSPHDLSGVPAYQTDVQCQSRSSGICRLDVSLPTAFMQQLGNGAQLDVECMLLDPDETDPAAPKLGATGTMPFWQSQRLRESTANTVYATLPEAVVYPGDTFEIEIRSLFTVYIKTAEVRITVGAGLQIVSDTPAKDSSGKDVFFGTMDRSPTLASASLARKEGTSLETNGRPTNELLFKLTVKVKADAASDDNGTIAVEGIRFKDGNEALLGLEAAGAVVDRSGTAVDSLGAVHIKTDDVVQAMSHANGPTELLNTAVISGTVIQVPIQVMGIKRRGGEVDITDTCTCMSSNPDALQVDESDCIVILDGTETAGSSAVEIMAECDAKMSATTMFRVHAPTSVRLQVESAQLRPIAGWFNADADSSCSLLKYQAVRLVAKATFSDGSADYSTFADFDISNLVKLQTSDQSIASVSRGDSVVHIRGEAPGAFAVSAVARNGSTLATVAMQVMDATGQSMLAVIGLDVHFVDALGDITFAEESPLPRNHVVGVSIAAPHQIELQYEGDSMGVVVWAVLDDHSRVMLTPSNGLVTRSLHSAAAEIITDGEFQRIEVVPNPEQHTGPLLNVSWVPTDGCFAAGPGFSLHAHQQIELEVTPPPAEKMVATASSTLLVSNGDVAANLGADYPTTTQISVSLHFTDKVQPGLQTDARASFVVSEGAPFTVDSDGFVRANAKGSAVGTGLVTVRFEGQNVTDAVHIEVTKFASLNVFALPHPAYPGSSDVPVATLSAIECTRPVRYQQAELHVTLFLQNGLSKSIASEFTTFRVVQSTAGILSETARIVSVNGSGTASIYARFGSAESTAAFAFSIIDAPVVTFDSLDTMRLLSSSSSSSSQTVITTLAGEQGVAFGNVKLGATLSDDRQYAALFDGSRGATPALAGVVRFESLEPGKLEVDANQGAVRLLDNHYEPVSILARTCSTSAKERVASVSIAANLQPVKAGDVDLGATNGPPVAAKPVGAKIKVPVRINTGGKKLAAFNLRLQFDPTILTPIISEVRHTIPASKGAVDIKVSVSESGDEIVLAAVIQRSNVKGGSSGVGVAEVVFIATAPGVTTLTGIAVQLLDDTSGDPQPIGEPNTPFKAGLIPLAILSDGDGDRSRRDNAAPSTYAPAVMETQSHALRLLKASPQQQHQQQEQEQEQDPGRVRRRDASGALGRADANCDGKISLEDPIRINDYIAARNGGFQTALGKSIAAASAKCREDLGLDDDDATFLDPDGNMVVEGIDATYLLDIMVQNFYFYDVAINIASSPLCEFTVQIVLTTGSGSSPRAGTRLLLDFGFNDAVQPLLLEAFESTGQVVSTDKGSEELYGTLVEAKQNDSDPSLFEFSVHLPFTGVDLAGLSLIQIANKNMAVSPRWKIFTGPEAGPQYSAPLLYTAPTLGVDEPLSRVGGYNPLLPRVKMALPECKVSTTTTSASTTTASSTTQTTTSTVTTSSLTTAATTPSATSLTTSTAGSATPTSSNASAPAQSAATSATRGEPTSTSAVETTPLSNGATASPSQQQSTIRGGDPLLDVFGCKETGAAVSILAVRQSAACAFHANRLSRVLEECSSLQSSSSNVVASCGTVLGMDDVLVDSMGIRSCSMTALTLSKALLEFNGVEDERTPAIGCLLQTLAVSQAECQSVAANLNQMMLAYDKGTFTNCTASTTATTSSTSTATTTTLPSPPAPPSTQSTASSSTSSTLEPNTKKLPDSRLMLVITPPFDSATAEKFRLKVLHMLYTKGFVAEGATVEAESYGTYIIEVSTHDKVTADAVRSAARSDNGINFDLGGVWHSADLLEDVYVSKPGLSYEPTRCSGTRFGTLRFPEVQFAPGEGELIKSFENNTLALVQTVAEPFGIQFQCARMVSYPEDGTDVELYLTVTDFSQAGSDSAPNFPAMCGGLTKELVRMAELRQGEVASTFVVSLTNDFNVRPTMFAPHLCSQSGIVVASPAAAAAPSVSTPPPSVSAPNSADGLDLGVGDESVLFNNNNGSNDGSINAIIALDEQSDGGSGGAGATMDVSQRTLAIVAVTVSCLAVLGCVHSLLLFRNKRRNGRMAAALDNSSRDNNSKRSGFGGGGGGGFSGIGAGTPVLRSHGAWAASFGQQQEIGYPQHAVDGDDDLVYDDLEFNGQAAQEIAAEDSPAARAAKARLRSPNTWENRRKQAEIFSQLLNQQQPDDDVVDDGGGDDGSGGEGNQSGADHAAVATAAAAAAAGGSDDDDNEMADVTYMAATSKAVPEDVLGPAHWDGEHTYETATNLLNSQPSAMEIYAQPPPNEKRGLPSTTEIYEQAASHAGESVADSQASSILYNNVDEFPELLPLHNIQQPLLDYQQQPFLQYYPDQQQQQQEEEEEEEGEVGYDQGGQQYGAVGAVEHQQHFSPPPRQRRDKKRGGKQSDTDLLTATMGTLAGRWQAEQSAILAGFGLGGVDDGAGASAGATAMLPAVEAYDHDTNDHGAHQEDAYHQDHAEATANVGIVSDVVVAPPGRSQFGLVDNNSNAANNNYDYNEQSPIASPLLVAPVETPPQFEPPAVPTLPAAYVAEVAEVADDFAYPSAPERVPSEYLGVFASMDSKQQHPSALDQHQYLGVMPSDRAPPPKRTPGSSGAAGVDVDGDMGDSDGEAARGGSCEPGK